MAEVKAIGGLDVLRSAAAAWRWERALVRAFEQAWRSPDAYPHPAAIPSYTAKRRRAMQVAVLPVPRAVFLSAGRDLLVAVDSTRQPIEAFEQWIVGPFDWPTAGREMTHLAEVVLFYARPQAGAEVSRFIRRSL